MIDRDFCEYLEYEITKVFKHLDNDEVRGFWCDGVLLNQSDNLFSQESVDGKRRVSLKTFIGKDGQTEYELILILGERVLSRLARNLKIKECVPNPERPYWFKIDTEQNKIEILLD